MTRLMGLVVALLAMVGGARGQAAPGANPAAVPNQTDVGKMPVEPKRKMAVKPPVLTYSVDPVITREMRMMKFDGHVQVYLIVDETGKSSGLRVTRGFNKDYDEAALAAVRQYKFKPATQDGKPVKVDLYIDVAFNGN